MGGAFNMLRWEWFKLARRPMPWILLAILFVFTQLTVWGAHSAYRTVAAAGGMVVSNPARDEAVAQRPGQNNRARLRGIRCSELKANAALLPPGVPAQALENLQAQCERQIIERYQALKPAGSTLAVLGMASTLGLVLLAVLTASTIGMEFGLGTLRPILVRGTGRLAFLAGKHLTLVAAATMALLLVSAAAAGTGALAFRGAAPPPVTGVVAAGASFADVASAFARTWAALIAFMTMAGSITLLTRSTTVGMALSIGYYIFESIFVLLMTNAFSWFESVGDYLPMRNITALGRATINLPPGGATGNQIDTLHAGIVVAAYTVVFAALAIVVFRRRDVTGAAGG